LQDEWGHDTLRVDEYEQWSGLLKIKHVLFIYDACTAGEAPIAKSPETRSAVTELSSSTGSRMVVTAGTADQQVWMVGASSAIQHSIFTDALLHALSDGTVESKKRGFITIGEAVEEAGVILAEPGSGLGSGHEMNPNIVKIDSTHKGTFVFLHPHADHPVLPQADINAMGIAKGVTGAGAATDLDRQMELTEWQTVDPLNDPQLYAKFCDDFPNGTLCAVAKKKLEKLTSLASAAPSTPGLPKQDLTERTVADLKSLADQGSRDALMQLGKVHESGLQGASVDLQASLGFYKQASDLGDGGASYRIGAIYYYGRKGVPKDDAQAASWFRKAADAGNAPGMTSLGAMYGLGQGGLPKDDVEAVSWLRRAADAGEAHGMANLGLMYMEGRGGLPQDDAQAVNWFSKAAEAGDGSGSVDLGFMYEKGRGGLLKDDLQAVSWYRKGADAGEARRARSSDGGSTSQSLCRL
jgi:TPR repeat protein